MKANKQAKIIVRMKLKQRWTWRERLHMDWQRAKCKQKAKKWCKHLEFVNGRYPLWRTIT